jgi:hypothetical protein
LAESGGVAACPAAARRLKGKTAHTALNFTGGYADNMDCAWEVVCKGRDEAAVLRFTSFDTEAGYDFVTLYAGAGAARADQVAELSGAVVPAGAYGARNGTLRVAFHSDGSGDADGFAAEYWCGARAAVGAGAGGEGAGARRPRGLLLVCVGMAGLNTMEL